MSYQVLARKWRPKQFSELVGQEHVVRALSNALDHDRTHHAYLFAGTRGIGKTTIARIFAKSINCEQGQSAEPCGRCDVCTAVDAGRFVDLLEIDAASNTGVDDVRELIENAQYAPSRGRYKIYLIDEVHMLSRNAFNALLKTLEEPPEHVKFLLATTDPEKLPMTVLSRCLKFNLKRLRPQQIGAQLSHILEAEGIPFDAAAVQALAQAADGSVRDGLSLLDQSLAYGGDSLREEPTRAMLGTVEHGSVLALLDALGSADGDALMTGAEAISEHAPDFGNVLDQLAATLHQVQLRQLVPGHKSETAAKEAAYADLAGRLTPEDVQLWYQFATRGRHELELAPDMQTGFVMVLLRMLAFCPGSRTLPSPAGTRRGTDEATSAPVEATGSVPSPAAAATRAAPAPAPAAVREPAPERLVAPASPPATSGPGPEAEASPANAPEAVDAAPVMLFRDRARWAEDWHAWIAEAPLAGPSAELARNAVLQDIDERSLWTLGLRPQLMGIAVEPMTTQVHKALEAYLGERISLRFVAMDGGADTPAARREERAQARRGEAEQAIHDDPVVAEMQTQLGARVLPESIRPR